MNSKNPNLIRQICELSNSHCVSCCGSGFGSQVLLFISYWSGPSFPCLESEARPCRSLSVALALSAHQTPSHSRSSRVRRREKLAKDVTHPLYSSFYLWWLNFFHACIKFTYPFIAGNVFSLLLILFGRDKVMIPQLRILAMLVDIIN